MKQLLPLIFVAFAARAAAQGSPGISRVFEYRPAPGQFVNQLPRWSEGDTADSMAVKAERSLAGGGMITLGAWGGYVVFGFDHKVENREGKLDFQVLGNAFFADSNPNQSASRRGGSSEPGIIMVSEDANGNGLPDDEWYEIAGSEYRKAETRHGYRAVYARPAPDHAATPDSSYRFITDSTYIRWTDNRGGAGYVCKNSFHTQNYYPNWVGEDTMAFTGTRLADNYVDESGNGTYYVQYCYGYGYADNVPNTDSLSKVSIDWAVDADGMPVHLDGINFVKVYTGVNQYCGWLGESSTEIAGAVDLHLAGGDIDDPTLGIVQPTREAVGSGRVEVYSLQGVRVTHPAPGQIYIVRKGGMARKTIWKDNNL